VEGIELVETVRPNISTNSMPSPPITNGGSAKASGNKAEEEDDVDIDNI